MQAIKNAFKEHQGYKQAKEAIDKGVFPINVWGIDGRVSPLIMDSLGENSRVKLIVTHSERRARQIEEDYRFYDRRVHYYPAKDLLFYYADIHGNATVKSRLDIFKEISSGNQLTIVTTIDGLMDKLPRMSHITGNVIEISQGQTVDIAKLSAQLVSLGYEKTSMVEETGQFSVRGGIIDIFPLTEECPYRVELWGDDVDSIRMFDVESQRSIETCNSISIYPAVEMSLTEDMIDKGLKKLQKEYDKQSKLLKEQFRTEQYARLKRMVENIKEELKEFNSTTGLDSLVEYFYDETVSFLDYIPEESFIFVDEPEKVYEKAITYTMHIEESMKDRLEGGYVLPTQANILYDGKAIVGRLAGRKCILMETLYKKAIAWGEKESVNINSRSIISYKDNINSLAKDIAGFRKKGYKTVILSPSGTRGKRLAGDLRDYDLEVYFSENTDRVMTPTEVMVTVGRIEAGFEIPEAKLIVIGEGDIFTDKELKKRKRLPKFHGDKINSFADVSVGDYVVHQNHGIGIYKGIQGVETDGRLKDYITIEYEKGSQLFIPVEQLDMIGKFSGKEGAKPKLNKLGGSEWQKVRQRVREHVDDIAQELINLYAIRESSRGFSYSEDSIWQREFEEMFPYEETLDQQKAIDETKQDMESDKIMDRLVCGDVGFGKTEVAIRAAFKAVQDNKQVAYLVPTTILAEQHYNTFCDRMKDFPINIRMLSRFCTRKEITEALKQLKEGIVDIIIGTHRILSKDVVFKNLGLLIIDEEQRFGVKHKEQIKQMKKTVDVLTLTATPIPRTLHMSMVGLRDISLLEEAPVDRLPIQTYVMEYDLGLVKEAINRELNRNGQVYYVYNRVNTIADIATELRGVLPDAKIEFAHGKMNERELEDIMHRFIKKEIDVLVSTTIIETGLDIPNVNTIIIHDADKFGLSQLYQLRGRVGRSNRSAYAFLMYKRDRLIKETAEKRLKAIREFTDLGSGYKISMRDLEIRGAGNLLGQEQSGNIEAVGYDLYCKMLGNAIKKLSGQGEKADFSSSIDLPVDAHIPENYVKNEYLKLDLYKRISKIESQEGADSILEEVKDRFGEVPKTFMRLLKVACLKALAHSAYVTEVKLVGGELSFKLWQEAPLDVNLLDAFMKTFDGKLRFVGGPQGGFRLKTAVKEQDELLELVGDTLERMLTLTQTDAKEDIKEDES
ncbi:MAG: transcription-repair coupling factor [Lachnospiraceae bacterium]|nr:transcription-repair coupling factor [Lachnospiraceae bacterium]